MTVVIACGLVAYNNLLNLWARFRGALYLPCNLALGAALVIVALGPLGLDARALGLQGPHVLDLALGVLLGAGLAAPLLVASLTPRGAARVADRRVERMSSSGLVYNVLVRIPLGTALLEELAFRGLLFGAWRHLGTWEAALASSVCFGLWHVTPGVNMVRANRPDATSRLVSMAAAATVVITTGAGLALVWLRLESGGLALPVGAHAAVNGTATVAAAVALRREGRLSRDRRCSPRGSR